MFIFTLSILIGITLTAAPNGSVRRHNLLLYEGRVLLSTQLVGWVIVIQMFYLLGEPFLKQKYVSFKSRKLQRPKFLLELQNNFYYYLFLMTFFLLSWEVWYKKLLARIILYEDDIDTIYFEHTLNDVINLLSEKSLNYYIGILLIYTPYLIYYGFDLKYNEDLGDDFFGKAKRIWLGYFMIIFSIYFILTLIGVILNIASLFGL
ncbi:MAG: hypothetical protein ACK5LV_07820 [Lachnospirales bacterium]